MSNPNSQEVETVCGGMISNPEEYPSAEYKGETVYFCAESCLRAFKIDPDRYMAGEIAHSMDDE